MRALKFRTLVNIFVAVTFHDSMHPCEPTADCFPSKLLLCLCCIIHDITHKAHFRVEWCSWHLCLLGVLVPLSSDQFREQKLTTEGPLVLACLGQGCMVGLEQVCTHSEAMNIVKIRFIMLTHVTSGFTKFSDPDSSSDSDWPICMYRKFLSCCDLAIHPWVDDGQETRVC